MLKRNMLRGNKVKLTQLAAKAHLKRRDTMNKRLSIMLAVSGAALVAASQAQAQYNNEDLLLDFRTVSAGTPTVVSANDVTVDLGNVNSFVQAVAALPTHTAVLDSGTGFTATTGAGLPTGFSYSGLTSALGTTGNIGFSAAAADSGSSTLWLTRTQPTAVFGMPAHVSARQSATFQGNTASAIGNIGAEISGSASSLTQLSGSGANANYYPSSDSYSYQTQGQGPGTPAVISYGGNQNTGVNFGGVLESLQPASGAVYEALEEVPVSGSGGSDTYEGYFTFQADGEVDFTAVPEPGTYGLLGGLGLLVMAVRRQFRSRSA